jgi:hypothetical protein
MLVGMGCSYMFKGTWGTAWPDSSQSPLIVSQPGAVSNPYSLLAWVLLVDRFVVGVANRVWPDFLNSSTGQLLFELPFGHTVCYNAVSSRNCSICEKMLYASLSEVDINHLVG